MTLFHKCEFCDEPAAAVGEFLLVRTIRVCQKHLNDALELLYIKNLRVNTAPELRVIGSIVGQHDEFILGEPQ